jgi:hypothetical protein
MVETCYVFRKKDWLVGICLYAMHNLLNWRLTTMIKPERYFKIGYNRFLPHDFHLTFIKYISRISDSVVK